MMLRTAAANPVVLPATTARPMASDRAVKRFLVARIILFSFSKDAGGNCFDSRPCAVWRRERDQGCRGREGPAAKRSSLCSRTASQNVPKERRLYAPRVMQSTQKPARVAMLFRDLTSRKGT